jgi:protein TonB
LASAVAQQKTDSDSDAHRVIQNAPTFACDFELKIDHGEFLVRRKGTQKWKPSSQFSEPIAIGLLDGDRKIYVGTKALKSPKAIHMQDPNYPESERKSGKRGHVSLHVIVNDQGGVSDPIVDSAPGPEFAKAAVEAVKKWTFKPAELNGQPVAVLAIVTMQFDLY